MGKAGGYDETAALAASLFPPTMTYVMPIAGMAQMAECMVISAVGGRLNSYTFLPILCRCPESDMARIQAGEGHGKPASVLRNSFSSIQMDLAHRKTK